MRIRTRIIGAALAVVVTANIVYTAYFLDKERREALARLQGVIAETNQLLGSVIAGPLYDGNVAQINTDLDSFFLNPDIVRIALTENRGDIAVTRERAQPTVPGELIENRVPIMRGIDELGQIRIAYTTANIEQRLLASRDELILLSLVSVVGLTLVSLAAARGLTRPVDRLTTAARAMADGHLDQQVEATGAAEVVELGQSFIRMRDAIRAQMAVLEDRNRQLSAEVSQRRQAEQERDRLISVLEATPDYVSLTDPQGQVLYINRAGRTMVGLGDRVLAGVRIAHLHPRWAREIIANEGIPAAIRDGSWSGDTALLRPDGSELPVSQVILSHRDAGGGVQYLSTVMRDISERKRAETALRIKDDAIAASINGIAFADLDGTLRYVNQAFLRMWGYEREGQILGRSALDFWQRPTEAAQVLGTLIAEGSWTGELTARRENGSTFAALLSATVIRDADGQPAQLMASFLDVTERRRAEEEARTFQNLVNVAGQGIGIAQMDAGVSYLNDSLRHMLGLARGEDLTKYSFYDFYAEADRETVRTQVLPAVLEHGSWTGELPLRAADGASIPTIHNVFMLHDATGAPIALANVLTDISEQRRVTRELRASEARFRSIIEVSPVPYALNDDQQTITYLNPAFVQTFGYTRDDIPMLADWWPRAYPDPAYRQWVAEEWAARLDRARRQGSAFEPMELNIRCKDGSQRTVMASAASLGQAFAGVHLVILYDVTERRRAEQALRASEARLRTILETEPECVKILAADGTLLEMNPAGLAMVEADSLAQLQGRTVATLVIDEQRAAFVELGRRVIENGESGRLEFEIVGLKGTRRWLETNAVPLRDETTGETRLLGVTRDITERRRAEEGIRTLNAELEQRVKDRTAELEAANRELEAFSYSVSHDLRAPLRAIDGFSRVLVEDHASHLDAEAQDYLNRVRNAVQRMGMLIDDLLDLSRVGRAAMHVAAVDLSSLAAEVVAQLRHGDPARTVEVDIAPGITAQGDPRLLRVVLENLLGNAWKYTGRTAAAHIAFAAGTSDGQRVYRIADNGAGFDMQYADKLFRPFQRLHTPQEFPGSGVGLATVARIVHRHGGRVWAEGAPGRGASIFFTLGS